MVSAGRLPNRLIDYPAAGIDAYKAGAPFGVRGWISRSVPAGTRG
ncbi:hypothetical protein GTS_22160 [Gandjariella thermophila]|uniref:Uncharacterized protein n=1 Tax=Gandjariella thermophila TaxID=1931992 RepID=A0A4D4J9R6_9PSEU|nr:hypothetical protein GTS_22160 [Gandjariella thermophila]